MSLAFALLSHNKPIKHKIKQPVLWRHRNSRISDKYDLKLKFIGSRKQEQLSSLCQQCVVTTVEESVFRMEMAGLESQEEDVPNRVLFYKPMGWLGHVKPEMSGCETGNVQT